jgi:hypothetical protein
LRSTEQLYYNPVFNWINTKRVSRIVLCAEIIAICVLHKVKLKESAHAETKTEIKSYQVVDHSQKKVIPISKIAFMNRQLQSEKGNRLLAE